MNTSAEWIWTATPARPDEHAEFYTKFELSDINEPVELLISADSDYGVYINGKLAAHGQYADYPHYKVYDRIDVTEYLRRGENTLAFEVWYYGVNGLMTYIKGDAGLWFELVCGDEVLVASGREVLSRISRCYLNYREKLITNQLGFTYAYDARYEDDWKVCGGSDFAFSAEQTEREVPTFLRPIKRLVTEPPIRGELIKREGKRYLFDFGKEIVGIYRI